MSRFFKQTTLCCAEYGVKVTIVHRACKLKKAGHGQAHVVLSVPEGDGAYGRKIV